ncbi:cytochrome c [Stenotrophomonas sp. JC08]|uniref:cytochrome c n=1 Tax=Stenotrophomonas sp. JC08 TaxID=3445779 RepID=UPI003FA30BCF
MSDPTPPVRSQSKASRYLIVLILGLLIGVVATVMAMRAIQERKDHFPDSLMTVLAKQSQLLRESQQQNRCAPNEVTPRMQTMRALSNDMDLAFPALKDDARFQRHASQFRATLNEALSNPPADCAALAVSLQKLGEDCKACHQDFR